jgi:HSP20 family molecular chaperone IbpA
MTAQPKAKKGTTMVEKQELSVREKKELVAKEEKTIPGRYFIPYADIYETDDALGVVLEMPGLERKDLNVALENDVLRVEGQIDFTKYKDWSRSIPSTTSATTRARSRCRTRSTRRRSAQISKTAS